MTILIEKENTISWSPIWHQTARLMLKRQDCNWKDGQSSWNKRNWNETS